MSWIDLHCHLNFLEISPEEAIKNALNSGVSKMVTIGTEPKDHKIVLELAEKWAPYVYCTLGVHPHEAKLYDDDCELWLKKHLSNNRVVAVGEIGLDYYYDHSPQDIQRTVFRRQLELAQEFHLPVQIHTRDAEEDTIKILNDFKGISGVIHCFTGTAALAKVVLDLGLNISISGVVTFKNADPLREIVRDIPLDRIHVETDAPFLTPVPFRGKKNEPAFVVQTGEFVANLLKLNKEEFSKITNENTLRVFKKIKE
ncbi:MAG: TatD family hydrolase [Bdellovibrionaceae bacterium]|nr:TatD family hydrolase [Pseudobdellovibrionaceae bacterium]